MADSRFRIPAKLDAVAFERILIAWEIQRTRQVTGDPPAVIDDQIAIDGKAHQDNSADFLIPVKAPPELQARATGCLPDRPPRA